MTERQLLFAAGLMVAWSGFLVGILRALVSKMVSDMEKRQAEQAKELAQIRREQQCCRSELAINFQRREDSIREYTALNVKLDRLYELMARRNNE